jgi:hypothetical protein
VTGHYGITGHLNLKPLNFQELVITTWPTKELLMWERHYRHLTYATFVWVIVFQMQNITKYGGCMISIFSFWTDGNNQKN